MRNNGEQVWSFETANLKIVATMTPCDDLDLSWDDDGSVREGLESGLYQAFDTDVLIIHKATGAELGCDSLGQSIYERPLDFISEHLGLAAKSRADGCNYGSYFPDMVQEACAQARKTLRSMQSIKVRGEG